MRTIFSVFVLLFVVVAISWLAEESRASVELGSQEMFFTSLMTNEVVNVDSFANFAKITVVGFAVDNVSPLSEVQMTFEWLAGADVAWSMKQIAIFDGLLTGGPANPTGQGTVAFAGSNIDPVTFGDKLFTKGFYGGDGDYLTGAQPEGSYVNPGKFDPTFGYDAVFDGGNANAVQLYEDPGTMPLINENLLLSFGVKSGTDWDDILAALIEPTFFDDSNVATNKIGIIIHAGTLGDGGEYSEWAIGGNPGDGSFPPIPEPVSVVVWGLLATIGVAAQYRRKRVR